MARLWPKRLRHLLVIGLELAEAPRGAGQERIEEALAAQERAIVELRDLLISQGRTVSKVPLGT